MKKIIKMTVFGQKRAIFDSFGAKMGQTGFLGEKAKMSLPYAYYAAETRTNL